MTAPNAIPWWTTAADLARSAEAAAIPAPALAVGAWAAASLVFLSSGIRLTVIDLREHRLPRAVIGPARLWTAALLLLAAVCAWDIHRAATALLCSIGTWLLYAVLRFSSPGGIGGGDVNYASLTGLVTGFCSVGAALVSVAAAFVLAGLTGVALLVRRRANRSSHIAFGPFMFAGALVGVVFG